MFLNIRHDSSFLTCFGKPPQRFFKGFTFANPHTLWATGRLPDVREPPGRGELVDAAVTNTAGGVVEARTAGRWRELNVAGVVPSPVIDAAAVYDRSVGRVLQFGGAGQRIARA